MLGLSCRFHLSLDDEVHVVANLALLEYAVVLKSGCSLQLLADSSHYGVVHQSEEERVFDQVSVWHIDAFPLATRVLEPKYPHLTQKVDYFAAHVNWELIQNPLLIKHSLHTQQCQAMV